MLPGLDRDAHFEHDDGSYSSGTGGVAARGARIDLNAW